MWALRIKVGTRRAGYKNKKLVKTSFAEGFAGNAQWRFFCYLQKSWLVFTARVLSADKPMEPPKTRTGLQPEKNGCPRPTEQIFIWYK